MAFEVSVARSAGLQGFCKSYAPVGLDGGGGIRTRDLRVMSKGYLPRCACRPVLWCLRRTGWHRPPVGFQPFSVAAMLLAKEAGFHTELGWRPGVLRRQLHREPHGGIWISPRGDIAGYKVFVPLAKQREVDDAWQRGRRRQDPAEAGAAQLIGEILTRDMVTNGRARIKPAGVVEIEAREVGDVAFAYRYKPEVAPLLSGLLRRADRQVPDALRPRTKGTERRVLAIAFAPTMPSGRFLAGRRLSSSVVQGWPGGRHLAICKPSVADARWFNSPAGHERLGRS